MPSTTDEEFDPAIIENVRFVSFFHVGVADGIDVTLCGCRFDDFHDFCEPECNGFNGDWEGLVDMVEAIGFVSPFRGFVILPCRHCEGVVKKENSFWSDIDVLVKALRRRREVT